MKARVKLTGEIIDIKDLYDDGTALVNDEYFKIWEQRRYELAKEIVNVVIANDIGVCSDVAAKYSVNCANTIIKRLKENNNE